MKTSKYFITFCWALLFGVGFCVLDYFFLNKNQVPKSALHYIILALGMTLAMFLIELWKMKKFK